MSAVATVQMAFVALKYASVIVLVDGVGPGSSRVMGRSCLMTSPAANCSFSLTQQQRSAAAFGIPGGAVGGRSGDGGSSMCGGGGGSGGCPVLVMAVEAREGLLAKPAAGD